MTDPRPLDPEAMVARVRSKQDERPQPGPVPDFDADELAEARLAGVEEARAARWSMAVPSRFLWASLSDFDGVEPACSQLGDWSAEPKGRNVLIGGTLGAGKSHAATAAVRQLHDRGLDVAWWPSVELLDALKMEFDGHGERGLLERLAHVDLLVLDDLGAERPSEWTVERFYALINRRWMEERPTVATTNLPTTRRSAPEGWPGPVLEEAIGERAYSRLVGSGCVLVKLVGPDRRRNG